MQFLGKSQSCNFFLACQFFSAFLSLEIVRFFPHHKPGGHRFSKASNDELLSFSSSSVMDLFFPHHRPGGQRFSKTSISGPCFLAPSALDLILENSSRSSLFSLASGVSRFFPHHYPGGQRFSNAFINEWSGLSSVCAVLIDF